MTRDLYLLQTLLISSIMYVVVRHNSVILRLQVAAWCLGVCALVWRFGLFEQQNFYSNDQRIFSSVLRQMSTYGIQSVTEWWPDKAAFFFPAYPLTLVGIHETLALKTISLIALLALSSKVIDVAESHSLKSQLVRLYFAGCGLVGSFFSMLALRETAMMYLTFQFFTNRSPMTRLGALVALYTLRPHLAASLAAAEAVSFLWRRLAIRRRLGTLEAPILIVFGVILGDTLYSLGREGLAGIRTPFAGDWGLAQALRVASNFVGMQFLTVPENTVDFSYTALILFRLILSETVIVPIGFTIMILILGSRMRHEQQVLLIAFSTYVSVSTNTDFNSFRQNLPFIPLMGLALLSVLPHLSSHGARSISAKTALRETGSTLTPRET